MVSVRAGKDRAGPLNEKRERPEANPVRRNPHTGERRLIAARRVPKFSDGSELKKAVQ